MTRSYFPWLLGNNGISKQPDFAMLSSKSDRHLHQSSCDCFPETLRVGLLSTGPASQVGEGSLDPHLGSQLL